VSRRPNTYLWDVGMINDFMGPGDAGYLALEFDDRWRRVVAVEVVP
jgi:hypothetical protein